MSERPTPLTDSRIEQFDGLDYVLAFFARRLERDRAELMEALEILAKIPIEDFGWEKKPEQLLHAWSGYELKASHVLAIRSLLAKLKVKP